MAELFERCFSCNKKKGEILACKHYTCICCFLQVRILSDVTKTGNWERATGNGSLGTSSQCVPLGESKNGFCILKRVSRSFHKIQIWIFDPVNSF